MKDREISETLLNTVLLFVCLFALCYFLFGCATIDSTTVCPPGTIGTAWGLQGNNVGGQLITMGAAAAHTAGFMAPAPGAPPPLPPSTTVKMHYSYGPWFGPDGGNTGCVLPAPPTTTINNNQGGTINMPGK